MKKILLVLLLLCFLFSIALNVYAADFFSIGYAKQMQENYSVSQSFSGNATDYDGWFSFTAYTKGNYSFTFSVSSYPYDNYLEGLRSWW